MKPSRWRLELDAGNRKLVAQAGELIVLIGGPGKSAWLSRLAGLEAMPAGMRLERTGLDDCVIRLRFDRHPPLWLGGCVREELEFGLKVRPDEQQLRQALDDWGLDGLDPGQDIEGLSRLQGLRLTMAAMQLAGADLMLLDAPCDALSQAEAMDFAARLATQARKQAAIVVVSANRWQDWTRVADRFWRVVDASSLPEQVSKEAPGD